MFKDFIDSFKHIGLLYPVGLFRIYYGYLFLSYGLEKYYSNFLEHPLVAAKITEWLPYSQAPLWFRNWLEVYILPNENWKIIAYFMTGAELSIGALLILGFLVRPACLLGIGLMVFYIGSQGLDLVPFYELNILIFLTFLWLGAGRCIGIDHFFYKRKRGFLW